MAMPRVNREPCLSGSMIILQPVLQSCDRDARTIAFALNPLSTHSLLHSLHRSIWLWLSISSVTSILIKRKANSAASYRDFSSNMEWFSDCCSLGHGFRIHGSWFPRYEFVNFCGISSCHIQIVPASFAFSGRQKSRIEYFQAIPDEVHNRFRYKWVVLSSSDLCITLKSTFAELRLIQMIPHKNHGHGVKKEIICTSVKRNCCFEIPPASSYFGETLREIKYWKYRCSVRLFCITCKGNDVDDFVFESLNWRGSGNGLGFDRM
jgi:hypothetical protein